METKVENNQSSSDDGNTVLEAVSLHQKELNGNIDLYNVNQLVYDTDGAECKIVEKSINSLNVWIGKKSDKGINATNWFYIKDFEKRFSNSR